MANLGDGVLNAFLEEPSGETPSQKREASAERDSDRDTADKTDSTATPDELSEREEPQGGPWPDQRGAEGGGRRGAGLPLAWPRAEADAAEARGSGCPRRARLVLPAYLPSCGPAGSRAAVAAPWRRGPPPGAGPTRAALGVPGGVSGASASSEWPCAGVTLGLPDHYGVFGVDTSADEAAVKKAYRKLVLQWHPDKHPKDREQAEVKIRQINDAYETLSNPFKRQQYDQQRAAFERKASGVQLATAGVQPRKSIPKEFMLSPMGHPAKFVRCVGTSVFVQSRADANIEFEAFFQKARFSLWWLPQVNNMCRIRSQASAAGGSCGGINFNFNLSQHVHTSEIVLSALEDNETTALIAVASPEFEKAFRFECAAFPGHYLAFKPPTHMRVVSGVVDDTTVIDFSMVDFVQSFRFISMEEVLVPAIIKLGGGFDYVSISQVQADIDIQVYFERVLQRPVWTEEDLATFFEGRADDFDCNMLLRGVRLRSKQEQLALALGRAKDAVELAATVSKAGEDILALLTMEAFDGLLEKLGPAPSSEGNAIAYVNHMDAQKKVLTALPRVCERKEVPFKQLLALHPRVAKFGDGSSEAKIADRRADAMREVGTLISKSIEKCGVGSDFTFEVLGQLCEVQLDSKICGEQLTKAAAPVLQGRSLAQLLPLLRAACKASTTALVEQLGGAAWELLPTAAPQAAAEILEFMAAAGLRLAEVPGGLRRLQGAGVPLASAAAVLAALGERGAEGDEVQACGAELARGEPSELEALPPALLLRLMVAATKSTAVAETTLDAVASAVSVVLGGYSMDDTSKLLLAAAKAKGGSGGEGVRRLYERAIETVSPRMKDLSVAQLIKIILAISRAAACRPLLEVAGAEAVSRMPEISQSPSHLVLMVQGLSQLGGGHAVITQILDLLAAAFQEASRQENKLGPDLVVDRRRELETKGQLTADQVAKLAQILAPVLSDSRSFWEALGDRLADCPRSLTSAGHASVAAAFPPGGGGPDFEGRRRMLRKVEDALSAKERGARDAVDMTTREKAVQRQREYERREDEHRKRMDREAQAEEKERQKMRERMMRGRRSRSRSRSRSRAKRSRSKSRRRSRSRSRDRDKGNNKKKRSRSRSRDRDRRRK